MSPFTCLLWSFVATFRVTLTRIGEVTTVRLNAQGKRTFNTRTRLSNEADNLNPASRPPPHVGGYETGSCSNSVSRLGLSRGAYKSCD